MVNLWTPPTHGMGPRQRSDGNDVEGNGRTRNQGGVRPRNRSKGKSGDQRNPSSWNSSSNSEGGCPVGEPEGNVSSLRSSSTQDDAFANEEGWPHAITAVIRVCTEETLPVCNNFNVIAAKAPDSTPIPAGTAAFMVHTNKSTVRFVGFVIGIHSGHEKIVRAFQEAGFDAGTPFELATPTFETNNLLETKFKQLLYIAAPEGLRTSKQSADPGKWRLAHPPFSVRDPCMLFGAFGVSSWNGPRRTIFDIIRSANAEEKTTPAPVVRDEGPTITDEGPTSNTQLRTITDHVDTCMTACVNALLARMDSLEAQTRCMNRWPKL